MFFPSRQIRNNRKIDENRPKKFGISNFELVVTKKEFSGTGSKFRYKRYFGESSFGLNDFHCMRFEKCITMQRGSLPQS